MLKCSPCRSVRFALAVVAPGKIVKRSAAIRDAPMCHGTFSVEFERLSKTFHAFRLVEGIAPVQALIEPELRLRRRSRNELGVCAQIEMLHLPTPVRRRSVPLGQFIYSKVFSRSRLKIATLPPS